MKKAAHGPRKIGAPRAANNGATVAQLNAIFGWTGSKMASLYTQNADRRRLAQDAITKLVNETATSIPSPRHKVRAAERKINESKGLIFKWWAVTDSNRRHPACKAGALPTELTAHQSRPISRDRGPMQASLPQPKKKRQAGANRSTPTVFPRRVRQEVVRSTLSALSKRGRRPFCSP